MALDGKRQRNAVTAVERALGALASGAGQRATANAEKAAELDQVGAYRALPAAVAVGVEEWETTGAVSVEAWTGIREALPPGPLRSLVDSVRD